MLEIIGSLIDLGLVACIFCLLKMNLNLEKRLKQTIEIVNHNADSSIKIYSKQEIKNNELAHCLECLCDTVEELEKPNKRGDKKDVK